MGNELRFTARKQPSTPREGMTTKTWQHTKSVCHCDIRACLWAEGTILIMARLLSNVCHIAEYNRVRGSGVRRVLHILREAAAGQENARHVPHGDHASRKDQQNVVQHLHSKIFETGTAVVTSQRSSEIGRARPILDNMTVLCIVLNIVL